MRIACIAASEVPSRKANSIRVMKVCQAFVELGHDVHLWLPGGDPGIDWERLADHYGLRRLFPIEWIPSADALRRYDFSVRALLAARSWGAELIYAWPLQAACLASLFSYQTLIEMHDQPRGRLGPLLFRLMLRGSGLKRILPISESLQSWLERSYGVSRFDCESVVVRSGVDLEGYKHLPAPEEARRRLGIKDSVTVGYTGHLYAGRGISLLYELAKRNPDTQFLWVGGEDDAVQRWRGRMDREAVANVHLTGFVAQTMLPLYQAACDVLVMPYERRIIVSSGASTEKFASPMKVFEYMAAGRAILSSDLPVLREVLHQKHALFAPPEDEQAWDQALKRLLEDEDLRRKLAAACQAEVGQYGWVERARRSLLGLEAV